MTDPTNSAQGTAPRAPAKSKIQLRIESARAELAAQTNRLSADDLIEIAEREELAKIEADKAEGLATARELDLDRRLDVAMEKHGDKVSPVPIKGSDDSYIVKANGVAYKAWDKSLNDAGNKKIDPQEERRKLVAASVVDWNGETDFGPTGLAGAKLLMHLSANQGQVAPLIQEICTLCGVVKEERKSKG